VSLRTAHLGSEPGSLICFAIANQAVSVWQCLSMCARQAVRCARFGVSGSVCQVLCVLHEEPHRLGP